LSVVTLNLSLALFIFTIACRKQDIS
jgi:hypothetical protein